MGGDGRRHALEQSPFDVEVLDDGFDDPVRLSKGGGGVETAGTDALGKFGKVEGRGTQAREPFEAAAGAARGASG